MPEADNLDLPEDMQLDGEDKDKDQGEDLDLDDDMGDLPEGKAFQTSHSKVDNKN
jgi:midasin